MPCYERIIFQIIERLCREDLMEMDVQIIEKKLQRIASLTQYSQISLLVILLVIILTRGFAADHFANYNYATTVKLFTLIGLFSSVIVNRMHISTGKKLEEFKTFSPEEKKKRFISHLWNGPATYLFWVICHWVCPLI